jgi:hypothetical protein
VPHNEFREEKIMACTESQKIKIGRVDGDKDKEDLKNCYFCPTGNNTYAFYAKNDNTPLVTGITSGTPFSFSLPGSTITWTIPNPNDPTHPFHIDDQDAGGSWFNNDTSVRPVAGDDGEGESGTFSAQAGGGIDPKEAYGAKA